MIKKWLIISMLFTGTVNADIFQALKDAATKAAEAQKQLKNSNEESDTSSVQQSKPQFNSLADEATYAKRQEDKKAKYEQDLKNTIIPRIQRLRASEANFYQKYLVKQTDQQESIDDKFKNKAQLYNAMQKDFAALDAERENIYNILDNNKFSDFSDVQNKVLKEYFKETAWYVELSSILSNASKGNSNDFILSCSYSAPQSSGADEIYVDLFSQGKFDSVDTYGNYLKCTYLTYQKRQDEIAARAKQNQVQKNQRVKLVNEQQERQKVQSACQTWRAKANKQVYSLGVGDQIVSKNGIIFIIRGVEANTFLVQWGGNYIYLQKSDCIPYLSINSAPSQYCYK